MTAIATLRKMFSDLAFARGFRVCGLGGRIAIHCRDVSRRCSVSTR